MLLWVRIPQLLHKERKPDITFIPKIQPKINQHIVDMLRNTPHLCYQNSRDRAVMSNIRSNVTLFYREKSETKQFYHVLTIHYLLSLLKRKVLSRRHPRKIRKQTLLRLNKYIFKVFTYRGRINMRTILIIKD